MSAVKSIAILLLLAPLSSAADGVLGEDERITSALLGYDLQYRVYVPENADASDQLDVLYVTDGPGYIHEGRLPRVMDRLIGNGDIRPVVAVFVDTRDPDDLSVTRRNEQFLCSADYYEFYRTELIPRIEQDYPVGVGREYRGILGVSFGGTNAACFGLRGYETFALIGMHSPANHPIKTLLPAYEKMPLLPLRIFLSTGRPDDNTRANRKFRRVLEKKGYDLNYIEVDEGHDWDNWRPLMDDVLRWFYAVEQPKS